MRPRTPFFYFIIFWLAPLIFLISLAFISWLAPLIPYFLALIKL